jgi:trigger factor
MNFSVKDVSSVKKVLEVELPAEKITQELDKAYRELKKKAKIKGFRPGKAPRSTLERIYNKDVSADVAGKLIQESLFEAIKESHLKIVGSPQVDPPDLVAGQPYTYEATVEINPEIDDVDFKGIELKKNIYRVQDAEIEVQLKAIQKNLTERKKIEEAREARKGDFLLLDYEGFIDGEPFDALPKTENFTLKVGDAAIAEQFDSQLVGLMPGAERSFEVTFPEDYDDENLANRTVTFQVKLHEIREEILPDIDDELAKKLGNFQSLDEVRQEITKNLETGYAKRVEQELNEQVFQSLIEKCAFELPDIMVQQELEGIISEAEMSFKMRDLSMEEMGLTREKLAENYRETAEKQVRRHLILSKIISQEKLTLTDEELEKGFEQMAASYQRPVAEIKSYYDAKQDKLAYFKHTLLEKEALKLIIDSSQIKEVEPELESAVPEE